MLDSGQIMDIALRCVDDGKGWSLIGLQYDCTFAGAFYGIMTGLLIILHGDASDGDGP